MLSPAATALADPFWCSDGAPAVMGILNVTPDSFSDGGALYDAPETVCRWARAMLADGAAVLDIGAVSTRPGAPPVSEQEELDRLLPPLDAMVARGIGPISVDTSRAKVADEALAHGALMINDVRAARSSGMLEVLARRRPLICLMHMRGAPLTMQTGDIDYDDPVADVATWLADRVNAVVQAGVPLSQILVDPGIGFGKTDEHNLELTRGIGALRERTGCAVLYGASRKSLIGRIAGAESPTERLAGSLALAGAAARRGARILRVHDVRQTVQYLKVSRRLEDS